MSYLAHLGGALAGILAYFFMSQFPRNIEETLDRNLTGDGSRPAWERGTLV